MASPLLEDEGILREWAPLTDLLKQIPIKAQRGIFTQDLYLTCVDVLPEFIAVGTNLGLVYWYNRRNADLQRLRCENTGAAITCLKIVSTVDFMVAAGSDHGAVTVFQIPKSHPECIPDSLKPKRSKQVERYTISGLHSAAVTVIEWSLNGMKLFSGDKNGLVVLTEIDFYMHLSKSSELLNEKYEIVQLSYSQQLLLVSTLYRSIVCHRDDRWRVAQVGQKERKTLGKLGATFCPVSGRPQDLVVYSSRPGLRLWRADKNGVVQQTLIFKDALAAPYPEALLITPAPSHIRRHHGDHQFGPLLAFRNNLLVTHSSDLVYVLNPATISVVATVSDLRGVKCVAVAKDEIFVLEGERSLVRVAYAPEPELVLPQGHQDQPASVSGVLPTDLASSLLDRLKDSAIVPAIPLQTLLHNNLPDLSSFSREWNPIVTADEAVELPPVITISVDGFVGLHTEEEENVAKESKEVFNQSTWDALQEANNSRAEVLDKIGEQDFEKILFKPKLKKKNSKLHKKQHIASGAESGSDTMSTNSVRSANSDNEDQWSSERLDWSSDWSHKLDQATNHAPRSLSEETLVRQGDSIISEIDTDYSELDESSLKTAKPDILHHLSSGSSHNFLLDIKPDLRSPESIERDVADKERILAKVLDLDTLCLDHAKEPSQPAVNVIESIYEIISEELTHDCVVHDDKTQECENHDDYESAHQEALSSMNSQLSYGPPSGSSHYASLELLEPPADVKANEEEFYEAVQQADKWIMYKVPEPIASIAVCRQFISCIDCKDNVYYSRLAGFGLRWRRLDYRAKQVAFSLNGSLVWKLVRDVAYVLENASGKGPFGVEWREVTRGVAFISVDDTMAWLVSAEGRLQVCSAGGTCVNVECPWRVSRVSCHAGAVWALTFEGELIARTGVSPSTPTGIDWRRILAPCSVVRNMAVSAQQSGWLVDDRGLVHFTPDFAAAKPNWWQVLVSEYVFRPSSALQHLRDKLADNLVGRTSCDVTLAFGDQTIWITEKMATSIHTNKSEFSGHRWCKMNLKCFMPSTRWQQVTAEGVFENKGQLWLLSAAGDLFCSTPNSDRLMTLGLPSDSQIACLSAAPQSLWLLSRQGRIHVRQGLTESSADGLSWKELCLEQISGVHLTHVSCGCDVVWACDRLGDVYMAVGSPLSMATSAFSPVWILVDERSPRKHVFSKVFVGPHTYMVWALDTKNNVYVREAIFNDYQLGTDWVLVSGIQAVQLSVTGSAVWALTPSGSIYRRFGITQNNYIGDYWQKIPGSASAITASVSDGLWAVDKNDVLLRHDQLTVKLGTGMTVTRLDTSRAAEGIDDWEVI